MMVGPTIGHNFVCTGPMMLKFEPFAEDIKAHKTMYFQPHWSTVGATKLIQIFDGRMTRFALKSASISTAKAQRDAKS